MKIAIDRLHHDVFQGKGLPRGATPAPLRDLFGRLIDVCHALSYAHHRGVIHRDLKPSNIMLGEFGETLVIDWGLAKIVGRSDPVDSSEETLRPPAATAKEAASSAGAIMGSYPYMSPEQAEGRLDVGPATDIYSVGAILYRMITGRAAISGETREEMLAKARTGDFPRPSSIDPKIPADLEAICLKATALRPENRYASVQAFADDLERFLADEPVSARREPIALKISRAIKRNKELVGAAAALFICAAIGLAIHDRLIAQQRDRADRAAFAALSEKKKADRARGDAEIARGIALRERDQAKKDYMNNHETLNRVIEAIAAGEIASLPGSDRVRYDLSRIFLKNIDSFRKDHADDDSALISAAEGYRVVANIHRTTGRIEESKPIYRSAIEIQRSLVAAAPADLDRRLQFVQALIDFGETYRMNDEPAEAIKRYQEALAVIDATPQPNREHSAIRLTEGSALLGFGSTLMDLGRFDESIDKSRRAVVILRENLQSDFMKSSSLNLYHHVNNWIAMGRRNTAIALRMSDDLHGAESEIDEAIRIGQELMKLGANQEDFAYQIALSLLMKGELLASVNDRIDRAAVFLNQAIHLLEQLSRRSSATTLFQRDLAVAYRIRAEYELAKNDLKSSSIDCDRSIAILEKLLKSNDHNLDYRGRYAQTVATSSRIAYQAGNKIEAQAKLDEAIAILKDIVRKNPNRFENRSILNNLLLAYWIQYEFPNPLIIQ